VNAALVVMSWKTGGSPSWKPAGTGGAVVMGVTIVSPADVTVVNVIVAGAA
jgi:hypothetical protein